jgi:protein-tyrosine-phosphatase
VGLDWVAQSRGLALERGAHNVGPISPFALHALKEMAITPRGADRFPRQWTVDDLAAADSLVAVKETEHRPLMRERFGKWERLADYWNVHDVEDVAPGKQCRRSPRKFGRYSYLFADRRHRRKTVTNPLSLCRRFRARARPMRCAGRLVVVIQML